MVKLFLRALIPSKMLNGIKTFYYLFLWFHTLWTNLFENLVPPYPYHHPTGSPTLLILIFSLRLCLFSKLIQGFSSSVHFLNLQGVTEILSSFPPCLLMLPGRFHQLPEFLTIVHISVS